MSEYPEALLEKVAKALAEKPLIDPENDNEWYMREWFSDANIRDFAAAAIDALGLKEERIWLESSRRYVTDWEDA